MATRPRSVLRAVALSTMATAGIVGCSSKEPPPTCPRVAVVNGTGSLTRFAPGSGRDLVDVDFQASIVDLVSACKDKQERNGRPVAKVLLAPVIVTDRGPANTSRQAAFAYFVSVVDGNQQILTKQTFAVSVEFAGNRSRVVLRDDDPPIIVDVPNPKGTGARSYEILVGFQLDQSEIEYNLQQAGSGVPGGALIREPGPIQ